MKFRPGKGVFVRPASCLSDSEFLPGWKKCPCLAGTMIKSFFAVIALENYMNRVIFEQFVKFLEFFY